jgi:hypothetical protein
METFHLFVTVFQQHLQMEYISICWSDIAEWGMHCSIFSVVFCISVIGLCNVCPSIYGFWLPLWYLLFTTSDYPFGILYLRILITPLVSFIYDFWLPLWYPLFTTSDYPFGILYLRLLITPLVSSIYDFWLPLWYTLFTTSDYPFGILYLRLYQRGNQKS